MIELGRHLVSDFEQSTNLEWIETNVPAATPRGPYRERIRAGIMASWWPPQNLRLGGS